MLWTSQTSAVDAFVWRGASVGNESESYKLSLEILIFTGMGGKDVRVEKNSYTESKAFPLAFSATVCIDKGIQFCVYG